MKKLNKVIVCILAVALAVTGLTGCGKTVPQNSEKISIVTTIFPEYDWVKEILGDNAQNAELTMLLDNGIDLHSFQPSVEDITKVSNCDLFIYVGGESDEWVKDALKSAANTNMKVINLLDVLGDTVKEEEVVEGMEAEEEGEGEEEETEYDEHVWLSLKNTQVLCSAIADALSEINPEYASEYQVNVTAYNQKLADLDALQKQRRVLKQSCFFQIKWMH